MTYLILLWMAVLNSLVMDPSGRITGSWGSSNLEWMPVCARLGI
jgi:hypothetical protein